MTISNRLFLVTGGLGFIGKHFVSRCLELGNYVINVDVCNNAADITAKKEFEGHQNYRFYKGDIAELPSLMECDLLVNFAAESHVDESIADSYQFCHTNVLGVQRLLELIRKKTPHDRPLYIQISTDEVYGDISNGKHKETDPLKPSNPYSATKAAADMLVLGWSRTYGVEYNIIRMTNNYGLHQYPEKLIPKSCSRMIRGLPALMHGDGSYMRSWLHVSDAVEAILTVYEKGERNQIYNVCGETELSNREVLEKIARLVDVPEGKAFVSAPNRVGQDCRYSLDDTKIRELGWKPARDFDIELGKIIQHFDFRRFI